MKTDEIKQKYITRMTESRRYGRAKDYVYILDEYEQQRFEKMRQFELAGFIPSELTELNKIHLRNNYRGVQHDEKSLSFRQAVLDSVLEIFPDFYEIRFLSKGVYIR